MRKKNNSSFGTTGHFFVKKGRFLWKVLLACIAIAGLIVAAVFLLNQKDDGDEIEIEKTPIEIEKIVPKGEIVVCSAIIEDYTVMRKKENFIVTEKEHTCVQILKMKCSFKIDLDKVEYTHDESSNVVWVKLPELEYESSLQDSPVKTDDDEYWEKALPNRNSLKKKVAKQIKSKFDTASNRKKGERYAEEVISDVLEKLGYQVEFVSQIEKKKE